MNYTYYNLKIGNGTDFYTLKYKLNQNRPAQEWARLMKNVRPSSLRSGLNPWQGLSHDNEYISKKITRFNELIFLLNQWIPKKIDSVFIENDYQNCLNRLHIHFPELEQKEKDKIRLSQLSEFNDAIHELEYLFKCRGSEKIMLLLCPEIIETVTLSDEDYLLFDPNVMFGDMVLHYPHVGRNCYELVRANDFNCPIDQFKPQSVISVNHHLRFFDDPNDTKQYRIKLLNFYNKSSIKQVIDIDDPKLAFGFIKIGKLDLTYSRDEIMNIVRKCNKIISWDIK